ncbi:putative hydrophobin 2 [Neofusicoccum parvum]|uniref:Hydrophobin protein n=2 Tax=Neofusicoccum parvum TaxID=310453 RepID=R1EX95_BOTPV|nr:hypothetical protein UCRNP2_820 [Neofusicoccum parvum UCRNP2]GME48758.1 putative hydrophobin 2 [Neofusicoccum parvum]GME49548.1 putative hydrophobin 2 [Neofusicoccum parvum]
MQFITALSTLIALTSAAALPSGGKLAVLEERQSALCSSGTALCCQLDVLGVADATCTTPSATLTTVDEFETYCADSGRTAECCTLSLGVAGLICTAAN